MTTALDAATAEFEKRFKTVHDVPPVGTETVLPIPALKGAAASADAEGAQTLPHRFIRHRVCHSGVEPCPHQYGETRVIFYDTEGDAIEAWFRNANEIATTIDGTELFWRKRPKAEHNKDFMTGRKGWTVYSRFGMGIIYLTPSAILPI